MVGIVVSEHIGGVGVAWQNAALGLSALSLALLTIVAFRKHVGLLPAQVLIISAAMSYGYARHQAAMRLPGNHIAYALTEEPMLTRLAGRVVTQPNASPAEKRNPYLPLEVSARTSFVISATELRTTDPPTPVTGYVRVSVKTDRVAVGMGDEVVLTGRIYRPHGRRNPGETDWARWNRLQNIYANMSIEDAVHVRCEGREACGRLSVFAAARSWAQSMLFEPFAGGDSEQPRRLLDAMVLGQRSAAGRQLNDIFLRTGTLHFLTVSGFHVAVLVGSCWWFLRRVLRQGARTSALCSAGVLILYLMVVEHNAPVLRAATMGLLLCAATLSRRPFCALNWLALSAICILLYNPFELFRAGFQLSFIQVLVIFTLVPRVYGRMLGGRGEDEIQKDSDSWGGLIARRLWCWIAGLIAVCTVAWITALPLVLYHFGRFAPWGALQSIVISPLVIATIVLGFMTVVTQGIPLVGALSGLLLRQVTELLLGVVAKLAELPGKLIEVSPPPAIVPLITYALLLFYISWRYRQRDSVKCELINNSAMFEQSEAPARLCGKAELAMLVAIGCVWAGWLVGPRLTQPHGYDIQVLSVGSGSAILVTTPQRHALVFDAGTIHNFDAGETLERACRALNVGQLDAVAVSHANYDHYSGVATLLKRFAVGRLLFNPYFENAACVSMDVGRFLESLPPNSPRREQLRAGDRFRLGQATVEVLWPPADLDDGWEANDRSLVLRIDLSGRHILLPGDIGHTALRDLIERQAAGDIDLSSDVLIAPHHGAVVPRDTAAFYQAVGPRFVINSSGHERPKLHKMLRETLADEVELFSTHNLGAVTIHVAEGGELEIETPFALKN